MRKKKKSGVRYVLNSSLLWVSHVTIFAGACGTFFFLPNRVRSSPHPPMVKAMKRTHLSSEKRVKLQTATLFRLYDGKQKLPIDIITTPKILRCCRQDVSPGPRQEGMQGGWDYWDLKLP